MTGEVPRIVYGTAWKEERTAPLVRLALAKGFRGIDTAIQRRQYHEAAVGEVLRDALAGGLSRSDLFIQTKFTYRRGQDHRLPYDPAAPIGTQVAQSFESSCAHLGVDRIDSYLLHGPSVPVGLSEADRDAWAAMERLHGEGRVRLLGVSNVAMDQLSALYDGASVKPSVVQNRTFTRPHADADVRAFCRSNGLAYQGFSLLTAVPWLLGEPAVAAAASRHGATPAQVVLRYCLDEGMVVLTGTTSERHMEDDLATFGLSLAGDEREAIRSLVT
ncbi:MAG: aldo/keto reductase family protein [Methanobacteriota archaeon]